MPDDILEFHRRFADAELQGDAELLKPLLAEDFRSIGEQGFMMDKDQWIGRHAEFRYLSLETTELDVRHYDRTAILRCAQRSRAVWRGTEMTLNTRVGQVWVDRPEGWKLASIQFSSLGQG